MERQAWNRSGESGSWSSKNEALHLAGVEQACAAYGAVARVFLADRDPFDSLSSEGNLTAAFAGWTQSADQCSLLLDRLRATLHVPILVIVLEPNPWLLREALKVHPTVACSPVPNNYLRGFIEAAIAAKQARLVRVERHDKLEEFGRKLGLTPRELEVLKAAGRGVGREAIAHALGVRPSTVHSHIHAILEKGHAMYPARSLAELVHLALRDM